MQAPTTVFFTRTSRAYSKELASKSYQTCEYEQGFDLAWFSSLSSKRLCVFGLNGAV